jgi:uncharacterized protein (TIRG00374 family)
MAHLVGRKHWSGLILAMALSAAGLTVVAAFTRGGEAPVLLAQRGGRCLYLAIALMVGLWFVEGLRTKAILEMVGSRIGFWPALQVHLASNFAASVTPLAGGGPPVETYLLWRRGIPLERSLAMVSVRLLLTFGFFVMAVPAILLFGWHFLQLSRLLLLAAIGAVVLMLILSALFFYFVYRPPLVERLAARLLRLVPFRPLSHNPEQLASSIEREVAKFNRTLSLLLRAGWGSLALLIGYTVAIWGLFFAVAPLLLLNLGLEVPWVAATARQIVLYFLLTYVPLPGASGVAEVGYASLFASLVPRPLLAGFVAWWRLLTYYSGIVVGAPLLLHLAREAARAEAGANRQVAMR